MKKNTKAGTTPQEIPRGSLHMRCKPAPKILQVNTLEVPKESVSVITLTEEVLASLTDWHCCSVAKSCLTLCDPMDCRQPGFPVLHHLPKLAQTHVHWVGDAIQPSHPLLSPSPALNLSQHQGLFTWVSSSHQVAKVLKFQLQHQSFQWIFRTDLL